MIATGRTTTHLIIDDSTAATARPYADNSSASGVVPTYFTAPVPELIPPAGPKKRHDKPWLNEYERTFRRRR